MHSIHAPRPVLTGLVLALAASTLGGCAWFRAEPPHLAATESRPLEVPPDLVLPSSVAALQVPPVPAGGVAMPGDGPPTVMATAGGAFVLADSAESAFARVGLALGRVDGVDTSTPVPALNAYEVRYGGETLLVRLRPEDGQVRIDAIGGDGRVLDTAVARGLLGALRQRLQ